jgi:hypothetical protein
LGTAVADIFLSYAREDIDSAKALADTLAERGWTVWWDRKIIPGKSFASTIEYELNAAKCVIALWSKASVNSDWCKNEADVASRREVLVPALIERDVEIPLAFRHLHAADIREFDTKPSHAGLEQLTQAVAALVARRDVPQKQAPVKPRSRWRAHAFAKRWVVLNVVVAGALVAVVYYITRPPPAPPFSLVWIQGEVMDSKGQPVNSAEVTIDATPFIVRSHPNGHFLGTLRYGFSDSVLTLHVHHPQYKTYTDDYRVDSLTQHLLHITLDPL